MKDLLGSIENELFVKCFVLFFDISVLFLTQRLNLRQTRQYFGQVTCFCCVYGISSFMADGECSVHQEKQMILFLLLVGFIVFVYGDTFARII